VREVTDFPHSKANAAGVPEEVSAMTPYAHELRCGRCGTALTVAMNHDGKSRIGTAFTVPCPECSSGVSGEIPFRADLASLQVVTFERPEKAPVAVISKRGG
jgi:hypothetical protein